MTRPPENVYLFGISRREIRNNRLTAMHFCVAKVRTSSVTYGDTFPRGEGIGEHPVL